MPDKNMNAQNEKQRESLGVRFKELIVNFAHTSTVPVLDRLVNISDRPSKIGKLFWLIVLIIGAYFATEQTVDLVGQYFEYRIVEKVSKNEFELHQPLPAVTICANSLYNNNAGNLSRTLWQNALRLLRVDNESNILPAEAKLLKGYFVDKLELLSDEDRIQIGYTYSDLLLECRSRILKCQGPVIPSYSSRYGNCYTLNSGIYGNETNNINGEITMYLNASWNIYGDSAPEFGPVVIIHQKRTAPTFQSDQIINIYSMKWTSIKLQRTQIQRLKSPYASHCLDGNDEGAMRKSYYYSERTPYEYSRDACINSCLQREAIETCVCHVRNIPPPTNNTQDRTYPCDMFHQFETLFCAKLAKFNTSSCNCPLSCHETKYKIDVEVNDRKFTYGDERHHLPARAIAALDRETICGFKLAFSSLYYTTINEEPKIIARDIFGSIGGILALWLGISLMAFVEVFELLARMVFETTAYLNGLCCRKIHIVHIS